MTARSDITRWNRAGLRRIRYVDGNAATFLEELRLRLRERFPLSQWEGLPADGPSGASPEEELSRVLEQYRAGRGGEPDWGWEIARAFARACHVLGEHLDAFANEGFLGTATQWESVRRLAAMIGDHPAPAVSASTPLALIAKAGPSGTVPKGLPVQHAPPDGGAPIVFETLEDVDVDAALNTLRLLNWNRSPVDRTQAPASEGGWLVLEGSVADLAVGEPLVLEDERPADKGGPGALHAHLIEDIRREAERTLVKVIPAPEPGFPSGFTLVHVKPRERLTPLGPVRERILRGPQRVEGSTTITTLRLAVPPEGLLRDEEITLLGLSDPVIKRTYGRVSAVSGRRVELADLQGFPELDPSRASLSRALRLSIDRQIGPESNVLYLFVPGNWQRLQEDIIGLPGPTRSELLVDSATPMNDEPARTQLSVNTNRRAEGTPLLVPAATGTWPLDAPLANRDAQGDPDTGAQLPVPLRTSSPRRAGAGDLAVAVSGQLVSWGRLASVNLDASGQSADLVPEGGWQGRGTAGADGHDDWFWRADTTVYTHFRERRRLLGWQENPTPIPDPATPGSDRTLVLDAPPPAMLRRGRRLILEKEGDARAVLLGTVEAIEGAKLTLREPIPAGLGFRVGSLRIAANVVLAGHGEQRPERPLGNGDASQPGQTFVLDEAGVSFLADATAARGVRADLEIRIDGRRWLEADDLRDHGPTDPVYAVRPTEEGHLRITFGDGVHGRRLPTGEDNVLASYRVGAGLAGNLPPASLVQLVRLDPFVEAVRQPLPSAGGDDREEPSSVRRRAPAALSALRRAVSLDDFGHLAASRAGVWQARAFAVLSPDRGQVVRVVVVPAGGDVTPALLDDIARHLAAHALPGVRVRVAAYQLDPISLDITLRVDSTAFRHDAVSAAARAALLDALSLRRRGLGQPLHASDVYRVIEAVPGVEDSVCLIDNNPRLRRRDPASPEHVLCFPPRQPADLTIHVQEYVP